MRGWGFFQIRICKACGGDAVAEDGAKAELRQCMGDASSETLAQLPYVEKLRGCAFFRRGVKILSKAKQASTLIMPISDSKHAQIIPNNRKVIGNYK